MEWSRPELGTSVEAKVRGHAQAQRIPVGVAVERLEAAIKADTKLQPVFVSKLLALTAALREEALLGTKLAGHAVFSGLASGDAWRLLAPARDQKNADRWLADSVNQGSLAGMMRGFGRMVDAHDRREPVTADSLAGLHTEMTEGTWKSGIAFDDSMRFPVGMRNGQGADLRLEGGRGAVTDAGRAELEAAAKGGWFAVTDESDNSVSLTFAPKSAAETRARAGTILDVYRQEIGAATNDSEKRSAVAKATQDLYRSHLFQDGNTRTVVFATMNRLLLDAGMGPAILPEPRAAAGFSLREFAAEIEKGQAAFQALKGRGEVVRAADLVRPDLQPGIPSDMEFRQAADGRLTGTRRLHPEDVPVGVSDRYNRQVNGTVSRADARLAGTDGPAVTHQCWRDFDSGGMRVTVLNGDDAPTFARTLPGSGDDFRPAAKELLGTEDRLTKASRFLEQSQSIALNMVLGAAIGNSATDNAIFARLDTPPEIRMAMVGEGDDKAVEFAYRYAGKPTALTNATEGVALPLLQEASSAEASATIRIKLKDLDNDEFGKFEVVDGPRADVTLAIHPDALKNPALVDPGVWIPHPASEGREGLRV